MKSLEEYLISLNVQHVEFSFTPEQLCNNPFNLKFGPYSQIPVDFGRCQGCKWSKQVLQRVKMVCSLGFNPSAIPAEPLQRAEKSAL